MELPSMEHTFELNKKGSFTGKIYQGNFTYRRLSIGSQGKSEVLRVRLNGDLTSIDPEIDRLHEMLSWLRYGLVDYPDWWRESKFGEDLHDIDIVKEIYIQITDFEKEWVKKVKQNADTSRTDSVK